MHHQNSGDLVFQAAPEPIDIAEELENPRNGFHIHRSDGPYLVELASFDRSEPRDQVNGDLVHRAVRRNDSDEDHEGYVVMSGDSVQLKLEAVGVNPSSLTTEEKEALGVDVTCHVGEVVERAAVLMHQQNRHVMKVEDIRNALSELNIRIPLCGFEQNVRYMFIEGANVYVREDKECRLMDFVREEVVCERQMTGRRMLTVTEGVESNDMMAVDYDSGGEVSALSQMERRVYQDLTTALLADYTIERRPFGERASDCLQFALTALRTCRSLSGILPKLLQFLYALCKRKTLKLMEIVLLAVKAIVENKQICLTVGAVKSALIEILRFLIEENFPMRNRRKSPGMLPQEILSVKETAAKLLLPVIDRLVFDGLSIRDGLVDRYLTMAGGRGVNPHTCLGAITALLHLHLPSVRSSVWLDKFCGVCQFLSANYDRPGDRWPIPAFILGQARLLAITLVFHTKRMLLADVELLPERSLVSSLPTREQLPSVDAALSSLCWLSAGYTSLAGGCGLLPPGQLIPVVQAAPSVESSPGSRRLTLRTQDSCEEEEEAEEEEEDEPPLLEMMALPTLQANPPPPSSSSTSSLPGARPCRDDAFVRTPLRRHIRVDVGRPLSLARRRAESESTNLEFHKYSRRVQCIGKRPGFRRGSDDSEASSRRRRESQDWSEVVLTFL